MSTLVSEFRAPKEARRTRYRRCSVEGDGVGGHRENGTKESSERTNARTL